VRAAIEFNQGRRKNRKKMPAAKKTTKATKSAKSKT
jgi:hypothetical protein